MTLLKKVPLIPGHQPQVTTAQVAIVAWMVSAKTSRRTTPPIRVILPGVGELELVSEEAGLTPPSARTLY